MDDIYVAIDVPKDNVRNFDQRPNVVFVTNIGDIYRYVSSGYRVFKMTALPEVVRVETKVVDSSMQEATKEN